MLPRFSLRLPQTLRRESPVTLERPRSQDASYETAEWSSLDRKSFDRKSFDRKSFASKSSENVSNNVFSSMSTVFHFADFVSKLDDVSDEVQVFAKLIQRVRQDVDKASQLRKAPKVMQRCKSCPDEQSYIDDILLDVQCSLDSIGAYLDNARVHAPEAEGGTVLLRHKFEWVLRHQHNLISRQVALVASHHSLTTAISMMLMIENSVSIPGYSVEERPPTMLEVPGRPWLKGGEVKDLLRSPHTRQKWRLSQRNSSLPSILASEFEDSEAEVNSTNIGPVELAGSTPDDLPLPDNMDLYTMPSRPHSSRGQIRRMPTLAERVERDLQLNGLSTASTNPADKPILAKRYRPGVVHVRNRSKPFVKHRSLPTQLPCLPSHPSLITELSPWVLPEASRDSFESYEAESCDTPSTSVASSPAVLSSATSCPERVQSFSSTTSWTPKTTETDASAPPPVEPCTRNDDIFEKNDPESTSETTKKSVVGAQEPSSEVLRDGPSEETTAINDQAETKPPQIRSIDAETPFREIVAKQDESKPKSSPQPLNPPAEETKPPEATPPLAPTSPLTSQAKRRKAHARRMQAAYGSE